MKSELVKNTEKCGGGVFASGRKRSLEPKMATKHPKRRRKTGANPEKRLASPGDGRIITKMAKICSSKP
jgi:hypothetical protein